MSDPTDAWMPLYIGDYQRDTMRLNAEQHGAYLLMLMDHWVSGPLPDDDVQLASIARMTMSQWRRNRPVLERFFQIHDGAWHQKRALAEKEAARSLSEGRVEAGRRGGEAARGKSGRPPKEIAKNSTPINLPFQKPPKNVDLEIAKKLQKNTPSPSQSQKEKTEAIASAKKAVVDEQIRELASTLTPPVNPDEQLVRFKDWQDSRGKRFRDERAAFRNWLRRASDIARERAISAPQAKRPAEPMVYVEPWAQRMKAFRVSGCWNRGQFGPAPGEPGCRVPPELIGASMPRETRGETDIGHA